jgi:RNA polymerase sigma factor (sigma-70 family)
MGTKSRRIQPASSSPRQAYRRRPSAGHEPPPSRRKCYSLSAEGFGLLMRFLGGDPEHQGRRYEEIRRRLITFFSFRGCDTADELADEAFDRVAQRLREGVSIDAASPYSYFRGVAFLLFREHLRRAQGRRQSLLTDDLALATPLAVPAEMDETLELLEQLRRSLAGMAEEERGLILAYYGGEDRILGRKRLSEQLGIPPNALRIRVFRVRRKLEQALVQAGLPTAGRRPEITA